MKILNILLMACLLYSCSTSKGLYTQTHAIDSLNADTLSNYYLFQYIDSLTEDDYLSKLDSIKNGQSQDFFTLRMAYTKSADFSPYETDITDSLRSIVKMMDSLQYNKALTVLNEILDENYVNITSHLYCGYIYKELADSIKSNFHYNVYAELLNSIYYSGDGTSPKSAYLVITTKEEYAFLNWFGLHFNNQSPLSVDGYSFDLMKVTDPQTNEEHEIYFNIEIAFSLMRKAFSK